MNTKNAAALVTGLWVLGGTLAGGLVLGPAVHAGTHTVALSTTCEEDQPCWDCETMGNRLCGTGQRAGEEWDRQFDDTVGSSPIDDQIYIDGYIN